MNSKPFSSSYYYFLGILEYRSANLKKIMVAKLKKNNGSKDLRFF